MNTKEKIEVMQAYLDGRKIQLRGKTLRFPKWEDIEKEPEWNFINNEYRIKPEPIRKWVVITSSNSIMTWYDYDKKEIAERQCKQWVDCRVVEFISQE